MNYPHFYEENEAKKAFMLDFKPLALQDITLLRPYFTKQPSRICDSTVGGTFLWRDYFQTCYALENDSLFLRSVMPETGEFLYSVPMEGDVPAALTRLKAHCEQIGHPLRLCTVSDEDLPAILSLWPDARVEALPDWADYLYHADDLKEIAGKKYQTQRNHINKFNKLYPDWWFTPITPKNLPAVKEFFTWYADITEKESDTYKEDERKVFEVLDNFELYGFLGGAVWVDDRIVAMALGEKQGDTLYVHIEKADVRYHGAYPMMVREFAKYACTGEIAYINREDDAGDEGLRKSKLSWRPCRLLDKYLVHIT